MQRIKNIIWRLNMEERIIQKPEITLVGLAINVTLREVVEEKPTYKLANTFIERKSEIISCRNTKEIYGVSTDPENYNLETDKFEFFIGVEVFSFEQIPDG